MIIIINIIIIIILLLIIITNKDIIIKKTTLFPALNTLIQSSLNPHQQHVHQCQHLIHTLLPSSSQRKHLQADSFFWTLNNTAGHAEIPGAMSTDMAGASLLSYRPMSQVGE